MPKFGLGTWLSKPGQVKAAVECAIDNGYRHIDCAYVYFNEHEVGEAIQNKIKEGVVKREDLFITSKLWPIFHRPENMMEGLQITLKNLQTDYVDLYLVHWPYKLPLLRGVSDEERYLPKDSNGDAIYDEDDSTLYDTWRGMEDLYKNTEHVKAIGVSNYNVEQLIEILSQCTVVPAMNQCECHAYLNQKQLVDFCHSKGIQFTSYSPLGAPGRIDIMKTDKNSDILMENETILKLAQKYNKQPAQILIRFALQRDIVCIPKSVTPARIKTNSEVTDFELTEDDVKSLIDLNRNIRYVDAPHFYRSKFCPFDKPV